MAIQGRWKLANGIWTDDSGNGNDLTAVGAITQATGYTGVANSAAGGFGSGKYLKIADASQVNLDGMANLTIGGRLKLGAISTVNILLGKSDNSGTPNLSYLAFISSANNKLYVYLSTGSETNWEITTLASTTVFSAGTWYRFFIVYNGATAKLFINNVEEHSLALTGSISTNAASFTLGAWNIDGGSPQYLSTGSILDDFFVADHAFDAAERATYDGYGNDFFTPNIAGDLACVSTLTGALTVSMNIAGSPAAVCTLMGALTTSIRMAAAAANQSTLTGDLLVSGWSCALTGQATMTGDLTTSINLLAALVSNATLSGGLQVGEVTEDIDWLLQDSNGLITGASGSTSLKILRRAPSALLDWSDLIFKTSGWASTSATLGEVDAVNQPGLYRKNVEIGSWIDGKYYLLLDYSGTPGQHIGVEFTIKAGKTSDDYTIVTVDALPTLSEIEGSAVLAKQSKLDFLQKWALNRLVESADGTSVTLYDDDNVTPLKTWAYDSTTKTRSKAV